MRRLVIAALLAATAVGSPAQAQTIVDTFRQLKGTLRQIGGRAAPAAARDPQADRSQTAGPVTAETDETRMVPATALADDPSDTALERVATVPRRVATFDVRGFRLGMSPREVGRIGDRERFRRRWNSVFLTSGDFEVEATRIADYQLNRPARASSKAQLKAVQAFDPAGAELKLEFTLEPGGPRLSDLTYTARLDGSTRDQAIAALVARYGPPTGNGLTVWWADSARAVDLDSPRLSAVIDGSSMTLFLRQSPNYVQAARKRLNDRAQQIAAARGGGVRF